ncbi:MAG TPA: phytanoyl-CoA dioxygenase family protein [Allosphingosinicella sp.]|nr:phytanoyl-CoA dioxygenase family protein [Allosphingosinicella sp.]
MTQVVDYTINGEKYSVDVAGSPEYVFGKHEFMSNQETDLTFGTDWYEDGYKVLPFLSEAEFAVLRSDISSVIEKILQSLGVDTAGFEMEKYHHYAADDAVHLGVVSRTRDLFAEDFSLSMRALMDKIEGVTGFELTDLAPGTGARMHIIVRINRPGSTDFNPPHKDSYEDPERARFLNVWIPICGVTDKSSLPMAPGSHLLSEDKILRTMDGGVVAGKKYRVRSIASWDGRSDLYRAEVNDGELLIFSCHLIHGIAFNDQEDQTRVALEFRLFRRSEG